MIFEHSNKEYWEHKSCMSVWSHFGVIWVELEKRRPLVSCGAFGKPLEERERVQGIELQSTVTAIKIEELQRRRGRRAAVPAPITQLS